MRFRMVHNNYNVRDLDRSLSFYKEALGFSELRRHEAADGSFVLVFLGDGASGHEVELTWLRDHEGAYDLGENEIHLACKVDDYAAAHQRHSDMGCICFENEGMGIYFISDPDGYWIEIIPAQK